jgi:maleylacetate reductase
MSNFIYSAGSARVLFGTGTRRQLLTEVVRLGIKRPLIISTTSQESNAALLNEMLGERGVGIFARASMHTPIAVTNAAMADVKRLCVDGVVAIGGGSSIGLAKAIAVRTGLAQIVLPTTYGGSEMTPILGETEGGRKTTRIDPAILPETVIYDVELTFSLPPSVSATSGINAIAHAVEAIYARDRNPLTSLLALEAVRTLHQALPTIVVDPFDVEARTKALYAAWLCGTCLGTVGMSLHHKLCHTLGGLFDLPHAELHTALLPHALAYNAPAIPEIINELQQALGSSPPEALFNLAERVGARTALRDLGMPRDGIDKAVEQALANPYWNPRVLEPTGVRTLLQHAWEGVPPQKIA